MPCFENKRTVLPHVEDTEFRCIDYTLSYELADFFKINGVGEELIFDPLDSCSEEDKDFYKSVLEYAFQSIDSSETLLFTGIFISCFTRKEAAQQTPEALLASEARNLPISERVCLKMVESFKDFDH
ncbi:hypothetical protein RF11_15949 [Thelohanellus kitauei]|uniref:Uncharacterized protein n=1 Tax=Thelohanellus kitauei TaxID=669202 RepID=A0A0C2MQ61_THEKT|nr:hypothetical protein RF11_15949 [Thelohanellus kitauei]